METQKSTEQSKSKQKPKADKPKKAKISRKDIHELFMLFDHAMHHNEHIREHFKQMKKSNRIKSKEIQYYEKDIESGIKAQAQVLTQLSEKIASIIDKVD